ncbi:MAG: adenylate/guanylate cyclase domain-containing protein [Motiliproteus sp.]
MHIREEVQQLADEIVERILGPSVPPSYFGQFCEQATATGLPLARAHLSWRTLHPTIEGLSMVWTRHGGMEEVLFHQFGSEADSENITWQTSPLKYVLDNKLAFFRRCLVGSEAKIDYPILQEFRNQGATDYVVTTIPFGPPPEMEPIYDGVLMSWCANAKGGFSDQDLHEIKFLARYIGILIKMTQRERTGLNTLTAYLGEKTARRVLGGKIHRGDGDQIPAVILYCDLRNSTQMAEELPGPEYLKTLNQFFDCTAGAVIAEGGEILRFIGDGILAIFPISEGTCQQALLATEEMERRIKQLNRQRQTAKLPTLSYGLGLHTGEVMHGNIGVPERLDFSVTGPAANEAARIEGLTKQLGYRVLASRPFVEQTKGDWVSLGSHALRGVGSEFELFALASTRSQ